MSFLVAGDSQFGRTRQTPLGFYILAFVMYSSSVVLAKWIRPWTVFAIEELRDVGTMLLLIGTGFLVLDFPGTWVWIIVALLPICLAVAFFLKNFQSTLQMARQNADGDPGG